MNISVIGAGYVGLTTAACLADIGHDVFCSESDRDKLSKLQSGITPIFEPDLEKIIANATSSGRLVFGSTEDAIDWGKVIFICVGTPPLADGQADLSAIEAVGRAIGKRATNYKMVVEKSTVPVQTATQLRRYLAMHSTAGTDFDVASNPEFLREGSAVRDFFHPDRIIIGVDSSRAEEILREVYRPIVMQTFVCPMRSKVSRRRRVPFLVTDTRSAELIKHAANSFLAMKISFINMVADLCEVVGGDVTTVAHGVGLDERIGQTFLNAGIGFGGFCFPKDLQAFIRIGEKAGCDFSLLKEVEKINQHRIEHIVAKIREELWVMRGKKIGVWGLAFKPNTDDVRFAPSIAIIRSLLNEGAIVSAYDPQAEEKARMVLPDINYCGSSYEAAQGSEAVVLVTEWEEFGQIDWERLRNLVERRLIVDGRNMLDAKEVTRHGFRYISIGRIPAMSDPKLPVGGGVLASANVESGVQDISG